VNTTTFSTTAFLPQAYAQTPPDQADRLRALVREIVEGKPIPTELNPERQRAGSPDPAPPRKAPSSRAATLAVASGKGGVGKTTIAVNLAVALAQRSVSVCLIDGDLGLGNADVLCGLNPRLNLAHRVSQGAPLEDILIQAPGGFTLLPGASGVSDLADLDEQRRSFMLQDLRVLECRFDVLIVDCGAGIGAGVLSFLRAADAALIVTTPEPTSITDAYALIKCLRLSATPNDEPAIALVVNNADDHAAGAGVHQRIESVCSRFLGFSPAFAGTVRRDPAVSKAVCQRSPMLISHSAARSSDDVRALSGFVSSLCGVKSQVAPGRPGLVARLLRVVTPT
jgi:flagellar biosynthesis protein FlhG